MRAEQPTMLFRTKETADGLAVTEYIGSEELTELEIPAEISGQPVTEIASYAFFASGAMLRRITVPDSVRRILPHAFELCVELTELVLGGNVEEIGENFLAATAVEMLKIPASVRHIRQPETLPCRVTVSEENPFYSSDGYGLYRGKCLRAVNPLDARTAYEVREGTTEIGRGAFDERESLREISLPVSLENVADGVFANVKNLYSRAEGIRKIHVAAGQEHFFLDGNGFYERRENQLILHRWLGDERELVLREDLTEIGREAFLRCSALTEVAAGGQLARIGRGAFAGCPLREVHFPKEGFSVRFPAENNYLLKDLLEGFGRGERLYDFTAYDRKIRVWYPDISRISMMTARLRDPRELEEADRELYTKILKDHREEVIGLIAEKDAMRELIDLTELGFFDAEAVDQAIAVFGRAGRADLAARMMAYRQLHFREEETDFTI